MVAVNQILAGAAEAGASDVHINPDENVLHLRYRMDGVLHGQQGPPKSMHAGLVQRLKVMAQLDLTRRRGSRRTASSVSCTAASRWTCV